MRIGVDSTSWFNERGYGRFTRELLRALVRVAPEHEFVCFVDERDVPRFDLAGPNVQAFGVKTRERPAEAASADSYRSVSDMFCMTRAVRGADLQLLFYPTVYSYFPSPRGLPTVVAIHDTIAERFPKLTLPSARARMFWRMKVKLALWQADLVLTISDFSAREIEAVLGYPRSRIRVTHEAPAPTYGPASEEEVTAAKRRLGLGPGDRYFVYVGGFNPHKNVELLVRAHARVVREVENPPRLLLVGTLSRDVFHSGVESIRAEIDQAGSGDHVIWMGFVPDTELRLLHAGSLAVVLPSMCEGFGLPAAEAAACGAPVVATRQSPLPDLFDGGGVFFESGDEPALHAALSELSTDEAKRRTLAARALECARALTWDSAAQRALSALVEVAS